MTKNIICINRYYRHFKGDIYKVLDVIEHTETGDYMVYYKDEHFPYRRYVCPTEVFLSEIDVTRDDNTTLQNTRFKLIEDDEVPCSVSSVEFKVGQLVIYNRHQSKHFEIGKIKSIKNGFARVYYHSGDTTALTPLDLLYPISNEYCVADLSNKNTK